MAANQKINSTKSIIIPVNYQNTTILESTGFEILLGNKIEKVLGYKVGKT